MVEESNDDDDRYLLVFMRRTGTFPYKYISSPRHKKPQGIGALTGNLFIKYLK